MKLAVRRRVRTHILSTPSLLFVHSWVCVALASGLLFCSLANELQVTPVYPACVLFALFCLWVAISWRIAACDWSHPYVLFLSAIAAFSGGQILLETFHLNTEGLLGGKFDDATLLTTIGAVMLGIGGLHWGAMLAMRLRAKWARPPMRVPEPGTAGKLIAWCLLAIGMTATVPFMRENLAIVSQSGYMGLYARSVKVGAETTRPY